MIKSVLYYNHKERDKGETKMLNKNSWYYENACTGEITDIKDTMNWWAEGGDEVNCWHWSELFGEWTIFMVREP